MKTNIDYNSYDERLHSQNDRNLSYSLSPGKLTKGSIMGMSGKKKSSMPLSNQNDPFLKRIKVLEDENYKLQTKIKQVTKLLKCI